MPGPGMSSGTYGFAPSNAAILYEAFDRIQIRPTAVDRHHLQSGTLSLNLELQRFSNLGINNWKMITGVINLVAGQATYVLPPTLVTMTEMYYTTVNGNGAGYNLDRIMRPMTREQYAMIPNKLQPGDPTQFWFQRLEVPQVTIWQPAIQGAPEYIINWNALQRIQDAGIASGETPDIVYRGFDALCAALAHRLAVKFSPPPIQQLRKVEATEAWNDFVANDIENGPMIMQPNVGIYGRMGR